MSTAAERAPRVHAKPAGAHRPLFSANTPAMHAHTRTSPVRTPRAPRGGAGTYTAGALMGLPHSGRAQLGMGQLLRSAAVCAQLEPGLGPPPAATTHLPNLHSWPAEHFIIMHCFWRSAQPLQPPQPWLAQCILGSKGANPLVQ